MVSGMGFINLPDLEKRVRPLLIKLISKISDQPLSTESSWDQLNDRWQQHYLALLSEHGDWPEESLLSNILKQRKMIVRGEITEHGALSQDRGIELMAKKLGITTEIVKLMNVTIEFFSGNEE